MKTFWPGFLLIPECRPFILVTPKALARMGCARGLVLVEGSYLADGHTIEARRRCARRLVVTAGRGRGTASPQPLKAFNFIKSRDVHRIGLRHSKIRDLMIRVVDSIQVGIISSFDPRD